MENQHGTRRAMGIPGVLRRGRTPALRAGRARPGRLAQRRDAGRASLGAPGRRAIAVAQQEQRRADPTG
ncbi:hypothetical protein G6F24_017398 [Rhizopus arrhizus]|nr:hypothetical protein G6F24_017398 [Rhizopus arrhizus]